MSKAQITNIASWDEEMVQMISSLKVHELSGAVTGKDSRGSTLFIMEADGRVSYVRPLDH